MNTPKRAGTDESTVFHRGGYWWIIGVIGFTIAASLFVAASVFILYLVFEHGGQVTDSDRHRSLFALGLFIAVIAIPTFLLTIIDAKRR